MSTPSRGSQSKDLSDSPRRNFLVRAAAIAIGAVLGLVPLASGLAVVFDPLRRKRAKGQLIRVASLDALPDDGVPRQFAVVAESIDTWTRDVEPIGAVYLRRAPGAETPECLTAECPHAGCFVGYDPSVNKFKCPCHNSTFEVDGQTVPPCASPRAMDSLECEVQKNQVLVKFERFYSGIAEKVAKG